MMTNVFLSVFEISVSTSLIVAVLILLTSLLNKRYAAKWKYLIWIFIALRLLFPFNGIGGEFVDDILSRMKTHTEAESENGPADTVPNEIAPGRVIVTIPTQMTTPIAVQSEKNDISITLLDVIAFVWMFGSLTFISVHLISYLCYKRQVIKGGIIIRDARILWQISELKQELHIKCAIPAVEYSEAASPMIIGFFKPVLILPEEQYSSEELFFILKHELVHLKRGDVYFKLLFVVANAVHWFNPLIWIMQKEAIIDMELSCDERVTQGTDYAVRKAYTETLLSMLHKRCTKRTVLSTQFYGGKQIMKKRFKNILIKKAKKNGVYILICAVILTISLGTLVGCSTNEPDNDKFFEVPDVVLEKAKELVAGWYAAGQEDFADYYFTDWRIESLAHCYTYEDFEGMVLQVYQLNHEFLSDKPENISLAGGMSITEDGWVTADYPNSRFLIFQQDGETLSFLACMFENDCLPGDEMFSDDLKNQLEDIGALVFTDNGEAENTTILTFFKEGEAEQKQATLVIGDGYSIYLPDNEWQQSDSDIWTAKVNEQVQLWVTLFEDESLSHIEEELTNDGYLVLNNNRWKQEEETIYNVVLKEFENDVWGIFYCYPIDSEEGWGRELQVIADTFAVSVSTGNGQSQSSGIEEGNTYLGAADRQEIREIVDEFTSAYFDGNVDTIQKFLVSTYEWDISTYEGTGTISDLTLKGLSDADEYRSGSGRYIVSLEFRDSDYEDSFQYLTFGFVKQEDLWKIEFYGLEG